MRSLDQESHELHHVLLLGQDALHVFQVDKLPGRDGENQAQYNRLGTFDCLPGLCGSGS